MRAKLKITLSRLNTTATITETVVPATLKIAALMEPGKSAEEWLFPCEKGMAHVQTIVCHSYYQEKWSRIATISQKKNTIPHLNHIENISSLSSFFLLSAEYNNHTYNYPWK